jgi:hypothetical protein
VYTFIGRLNKGLVERLGRELDLERKTYARILKFKIKI